MCRQRSPAFALRLLLAAGLLVCGLAIEAPAAVAGEVVAEGVRVRWDDGLESLGREAAASLPSVRSAVAARLGWAADTSGVDVVLVHGHDRMREVAKANVPAWAVGVAVASRSLIAIRSDLLARGYGGGLVPVLRHEWVHLSWGQRAGAERRQLPLWAEEGLAEEIGGGVSVDAGAALDLAVTFGGLLEFRELENGFPAGPKDADLAYKQSRSWVRFVASRRGWDIWPRILDDLLGDVPGDVREGESRFEQCVRIESRRTVGEWHAAWQVATRERAAPWFHLLLRDFQGTILTGLALIGAVAFFFLRRRRRRQIARLPDGPDFFEGGG